MEKLQKKVQSFINASLFVSVAFIVVGILFLVFPENSLEVLRWVMAIFAIVMGTYLIATDLSQKRFLPFFNLTGLGVVSLIIGLIFIIYPSVMNVFPIILGAWFIVSSVTSLRFTTAIRGSSGYALAIITAILALICGILLLVNPWGGQISMMMFAGIMIIAYAATSLIDMIVLKKNIKDLSNELTKHFKFIDQKGEKNV